MPKINQADSNKVRTAVVRNYHKSAYHRNLTTGAFMQIQPLFYKELIPREKFDGRYQIWSRLNPLVNPTMGIMNYHYHRFFVRYKDVFPAWDDFYNRSLHVGSSAAGVVQGFVPFSPHISMTLMYELIRDKGLIYPVTGDNPFDFSWKPLSGEIIKYSWSPGKGVAAFKALTNLGYRFSWCEADPRKINLLPLMCFGKIIIDHFWPKQYVNNSVYTAIRSMFELNVINYSANSPDSALYKGIAAILTHLYCFYDNDGFYQGWDNPAGPSDSQTTSPFISDEIIDNADSFNDIYAQPNNSVILANGEGGNYINRLTKYGLTALAKLSAWMKRYQLAGSAAIDRYLARFGIKVIDMHRSIKLGSDVIEVKVGDVESNSDSTITIGSEQFTSVLGDLAGKGVGANVAKLQYNNGDHFGMYIGILTIIPDAGLYQGMDRNNYHVEPEHFWTPEIDGFGPAAVDVSEVFQSKRGEVNVYRTPGSANDYPFCFLPNQYEGCIGRNILSGAFALASQGAEQLKSWHLYRDLEEYFSEHIADFVHGLDFMSGETDRIQYSRVFYNGKNEENFIIRFRSVYDFDSFKKPLSENYDWEDSGKEVAVDGNSVELN